MDFYEVIRKLNTDIGNRMFTVCDGPHAGEKMIASADGPVWFSEEDGFFRMHASEALAAENACPAEIAGSRVFAEILGNRNEIVICGAGNVSIPVIDIAKMIGCRVTVIDDRRKFTDNALCHGADEVICGGFSEALSKIPGSPDTFFIIVTRGHRHDMECLLEIVRKPHAYIGMIGSRHKVGLVKEALADAGIARDDIDSLHMPIGLKIGAETPEEIAVSIMGEIIEVKRRIKRGDGIPPAILDALEREGRKPVVMATIVSKHGSSPRDMGARMLISADGSVTETIGGGLAEAMVIERAAGMLSTERARPEIITIDMTGERVEDEGMICGGTIEVLLEVV